MMTTKISLITGGASGIGLAFAEQLASRGHNLILVDKSADGLGRAGVDIRQRYRVQVDTLTADLADASDVEMVEQKISDIDINVLVNNAGFCTAGMFTEAPLKGQLDLIAVHCIAPMRFCKAAIPRMMEHHYGRIINVCSISAFCRFPRTVGYSATKGYLWIMSECLQVELVGSGVKVQALCPGWVRTNINAALPKDTFDASKIPGFLWTEPRDLVEMSLRALERSNRVLFIPRLRDKIVVLAFGSRIGLKLLAIYRRIRFAIARR